ncbi:hypothetical protein OV450_2960 [Actinobacteria bacterium OV450]|nr:hypothetical protein OV450_2960 [Actinobacteria bacterium OV450]
MLAERRWRFLAIFGSDLLSRSRGTCVPTGPTSVSTVLGRTPLRGFPLRTPAGSCFLVAEVGWSGPRVDTEIRRFFRRRQLCIDVRYG